jgi:2',3'-cyclic-nucleotide 3'-phosphodiesterase
MNIDFRSNSKVVIIMRGCPGSGKSTSSQALIDYLSETGVMPALSMSKCSADDYMKNEDGDYEYNHAKISMVHGRCKEQFMASLAKKNNLIIVDNTNIKLFEFKVYVNAARNQGYEVYQWELELRFDNMHGVPFDKVEQMQKNYKPSALPTFEPSSDFHDFLQRSVEEKKADCDLAEDEASLAIRI